MKMKLFCLAVIALIALSCSKDSNSTNDQKQTFSLTVNCDTSKGDVISNSTNNNYSAGDTVSLKAIAKDGYVFSHWKLENDLLKQENPYRFVINQKTTVEAIFEAKTADAGYNLKIDYNNVEGIVTANPYKTTYKKGDVVELSASALSGYEFNGWSNSTSKETKITITISQDTSIVALFKRKEITGESKPNFSFSGERIKKSDGSYYWSFKAYFTPLKNTAEAAIIHLNNTKITLDNGSYIFSTADLAPGKLISFELTHSSLSKALTATLKVPDNFVGKDDLTATSDKDNFYLQWPLNACDGYVLNRKLGNITGCISLDFGINSIKDNKLTIAQTEILDPSPVATNLPMTRYAISISPVFLLNNFTDFSTESFIVLKGSATGWITNYNNKAYWGL